MAQLAAVILAGGSGRRLGGAGKPSVRVAGRSMLARVLRSVAEAAPIVVVGPPELAAILPPGVLLTREDPPGGGPVAALSAGLARLTPGRGPAGDTQATDVAVLASDLPFLTQRTIGQLHRRAHGIDVEAAVLVDDAGREQWLCGVWRLAPLQACLGGLGQPDGRGMRELATRLRIARLSIDATGPPAWFDCDTEEDLRQAEEWAHGDTGRMDR